MNAPTLAPDIQRKIAELRATRPYDGRRVRLRESRNGWKYTGLSGICTHLAADCHTMTLLIEEDPEDYWPAGMEILVDLDHETIPLFDDYEGS